MTRTVSIVGAPSSIGIRPYDDGTARRLDLAPAALREQNLVTRLRATDLGDVLPAPYRDFTRPERGVRNEREVAAYSRALAQRIAQPSLRGDFVLLLGGDCSIVLAGLLGVRASRSRVGLVYVDAHADFATPQESRTGSAASMCLALAVGRGDSPLARLAGPEPLVRAEDVVVVARRDQSDDKYYGEDALRVAPLLDLPHSQVRERGPQATAARALERVTRPGIDGFWIHVDADVIDPSEMPAVDSPEPGGLTIQELTELLRPLVRHPRALGMELTIYDPNLDPDRSGASKLATLLERVARRLEGGVALAPEGHWENLVRSRA